VYALAAPGRRTLFDPSAKKASGDAFETMRCLGPSGDPGLLHVPSVGCRFVARSRCSVLREPRFVFDEAAELYARARPSYPLELIEDLVREADLRPGARILELGAGPGTASVSFAGRGYRLLCLEPGEKLAEIAKTKLAAETDAQVAVTTFEDWALEKEAFDLLFAAQSFHWIDPTVRFSKAAEALKPTGTLAIFANRPLRGNGPVDVEIQQAYAAHAPELEPNPAQLRFYARGVDTNTRDNFLGLFATTTEFQPAQCREYPWRAEYRAAEYSELLQTHSDHRLLPAERLRGLLGAIREAIEQHGGRLPVDYVAVMCWARRA
jgi:SAM-dependent methyltransferase